MLAISIIDSFFKQFYKKDIDIKSIKVSTCTLSFPYISNSSAKRIHFYSYNPHWIITADFFISDSMIL